MNSRRWAGSAAVEVLRVVLDGDQPVVVGRPTRSPRRSPSSAQPEATRRSPSRPIGLVVGGVHAQQPCRPLIVAIVVPSSRRSSCARTVRSAGPRWSTGPGGRSCTSVPAECDVDQLQAPAHAEDRDTALEAAGQDGVLERVARLVDVRRRVDLLAPACRVRVGAAGQHQSVELLEERVVRAASRPAPRPAAARRLRPPGSRGSLLVTPSWPGLRGRSYPSVTATVGLDAVPPSTGVMRGRTGAGARSSPGDPARRAGCCRSC